jgi:proteic killer suppression protein
MIRTFRSKDAEAIFNALKGDRAGQYSVRINQQWRICFKWQDGDVLDVEIVDYH